LQQGIRWATTAIVTLLVLALLLTRWGSNLYIDWLWFKSLAYNHVFVTIILTDLGVRLAVGTAVFVALFINLYLTRPVVLKAINATRQQEDENGVVTLYQSPLAQYLNSKNLLLVYGAVSMFFAFFVGLSVTGDWITVQKFLNATPFGTNDPIFNKDIGFYVFQLPFYQFIYKILAWIVLLSALCVASVYLLTESGQTSLAKLFNSMSARFHLSALAAIFFILRAWGYRLEQYMLLYAEGGVIYGGGYADINGRLLAFKILLVVALVCAAVILVNIFMRKFKLVLYSIGALVVSSIILGGVYPAVLQKFIVEPNEFNREQPYIAHSIKYTRQAYDLNKIERSPFPAGRTLTAQDIKDNPETIDNIRLWDWRPLEQTYGQLQAMRLYYEFKGIDIDRYTIDGNYRQVMIAARELNQNLLPEQAKAWVNQKLQYTHGYGIVMSPVNEVTNEGLPNFLIKDIPPQTKTDLVIDRPEIYYGEATDEYVMVNTKTQEFDYPMGDDNAWTTYEETSGVKINSLFRRAIFALAFTDYRMVLSTDMTNDTQVLFNRNIYDRVPKIAPFLRYDKDPYIVLSDGRLYWMWDAYTVSNMYPYSDPFSGRMNYIRNSVKVTVDAYNGDVKFYVADETDPIIQTFSKIFPNMFLPLAELSDDLKSHMRYPEELFLTQARKLATYHMIDPRIFFHKEDKWNLPNELYGTEEQPMEPYYTITKLPGEDESEFVLILPYTPQNRSNMISWLAARMDGENYGKLINYQFPKQELVYGPMQIEARINQDPVISQQLTLWDQRERGFSVIRGNLLAIPIKDSLLYVEPIFLQAETSRIPELRRVIVAHEDRIVMEPTLELALQKMFGDIGTVGPPPAATGPDRDPAVPLPVATLSELAKRANQQYDDAQNKLRQGDWAGYGEAVKQLEQTLKELSEQADLQV